jgi:alpha-L-fucosidase
MAMRRSILGTLLVLSLLGLIVAGCDSPGREPSAEAPAETADFMNESPEATEARMEWWKDARFGLFIHWGPYAVPAGEYQGETVRGVGEWIMNSAQIPISEYETYAEAFNPVLFDAAEWVRIAEDAGMKYIIITSKHHDGFGIWDSEVSDYDIMDASPFGRDVLRELRDAADEAGMRLGFYHSIMDWHHPDAQGPHYPTYNTGEKSNPRFPYFVQEYLKPQVTELVEGYDPDVLWFDGEWIPEWTHEMGMDMYNHVRGLKPDILVNNRVDKGRQGMQGMNRTDRVYAGDFGTPEQEILVGASALPWESCMTMNDSWGFKATDENWKTTETLIHNLVDIVAKGGNYLLNVGPTAEGLIPEASVERLAEMGEWVGVNGEAIYGTRPWEHYQDGESIRYTYTGGDAVYAVSFGWPGEELVLHRIEPEEGSEIRMLGYDEALAWTFQAGEGETGAQLTIDLPDGLQDESNRPGKYAYAFRIQGEPIAPGQSS